VPVGRLVDVAGHGLRRLLLRKIVLTNGSLQAVPVSRRQLIGEKEHVVGPAPTPTYEPQEHPESRISRPRR